MHRPENHGTDPNTERLVALLQLKRHETPGEDYHERFLSRFHARQREERLKGSSLHLFAERVGVFFDQMAGGRWVAGGLVGYAAILIAAFVLLQWSAQPGPGQNPLRPASWEMAPAPGEVPVQIKVTPVHPLKTPLARTPEEDVAGE